VPTYVLRLWLPDRPGALGAVASRIGAVGGDVVGIDILERGGGRAVDELVVELPDAGRVSLMLGEIRCVDGADVEEVRERPADGPDPHLDALATAAGLTAARGAAGVVDLLAAEMARLFDASWAVVVDLVSRAATAVVGEPPPAAWLVAFVDGSRASIHAVGDSHEVGDVAWAPLDTAGSALVLGRHGRPFHTVERRRLDLLAAVADARLAHLLTGPTPAASTEPVCTDRTVPSCVCTPVAEL
jgi:hypothetical protein